MNVGDCCQRNVVTVRATDEISAAAHLMREKHVGYLVVVEATVADGKLRPVGVLTDRDLVVSVMARDANPGALRVGDVMTRNPMTARFDEPLPAALRTMRGIGVRRLPVVGSSLELVGVIALDDVVEAFASQLQDVAASIHSEQAVERAMRP